jgi:hypothetical protein
MAVLGAVAEVVRVRWFCCRLRSCICGVLLAARSRLYITMYKLRYISIMTYVPS